jgi:Ca-activated chloride channel family protein
VSQYDSQGEEGVSKALKGLDLPPPAPGARRRAIALAREEFESLQGEKTAETAAASQGFLSRMRHIIGQQPDDGSTRMLFNQRFVYSGITAAAIGAVAVGLSLQHLEQKEQLQEELNAQPAASKLAPAPAPRMAEEGRSADLGIVAQDSDVIVPPAYQAVGRDDFQAFEQNRVRLVSEEPVSTFSADVDTASYSFVRRMLNSGVLPQGDAVRAEEMINYFDYDYPLPASKAQPFKPSVVVSDSPWGDGRKLLHIGIKGYELAHGELPRSNLVFLLDVSGSMNSPDKLPLVKQSMGLLLSTLQPDDTVAIAVYAGAAGTVLEPTPVREKQTILGALRQLNAGGSTAGAQGIRLAYELAEANFDEKAVNRVILATDGDFNVGITDRRELQSFIERKREQGVYLSVLGFGQGNYHDALMQTLAQNGNGVAAYIDTLGEAQKVLVDEATSALFPIATDVKLQVEFNPATVAEYRLIGYETRHLNREDFNNDAVDAGDIGAGHTVTAIYEFTPVGSNARQIEESRYAQSDEATSGTADEYAFLKLRYKLPGQESSNLISRPITPDDAVALSGEGIGGEAGFATAVAGFAQLLKGRKYTGSYDYDDVIALAQANRGDDPYGYRTEFVQLVRKAKSADAMRAR